MKQSKKIMKNAEDAKYSKKIKHEKVEESSEAVKLIKIIAVVALIFLVMYGVTYLIKKPASETKTTFNNEIIVGQIWNRSETTYMVLLDNSDDSEFSTYQTNLKKYADSQENYGYYTVKLDSVFNKSAISETSNLEATGENFKVKGITLLVISDGKVTSSYEGTDKVSAQLSSLVSSSTSESTSN